MKTLLGAWARRTLSPPMVVALLALVVASSSATYAAVVVTGKNVVNGSLTTKDVKDHSLLKRDLKAGQLPPGPDSAAQLLTKVEQVDGAGSGLDADTIDGISSGDVLLGTGDSRGTVVAPSSADNADLFGGRLRARLTCPASLASNATIRIVNNDVGSADLFVDDGSASAYYVQLASGGFVEFATPAAGAMLMVHVQWADSRVASVAISSVNRVSDCKFLTSGILLP